MYLLKEHYRQFESKMWRFLYEEAPATAPTAAEAPATAPTAEKETPAPLDDTKIGEIKTEIGKTYDTLQAKLGKDVLTPKEKESLKSLREGSNSKVETLKTEYTTAIKVENAKKDAGMTKVKGTLEASITELIKEHDKGANDDLDENQEKTAYAILQRQLGIKQAPAKDSTEYKAFSILVGSLTPDQVKEVKKDTDKIELTDEQIHQVLGEAFKDLPKNTDAKPEETEALKAFINAVKATGPLSKLGAAQDEIIKYIATGHIVEAAKDKPGELKIDGAKDIKNGDDFIGLLPDKMQAQIKALPKEGDPAAAAAAAITTLTQGAKKGTEGIQNAVILKAALEKMLSADEKDGKKSDIAKIFGFLKIFGEIMQAIKTQNFKPLEDMMAVYEKTNSMEKTLEAAKDSKKTYTEALENMKPPNEPKLLDLLKAHADPEGAGGDKVFKGKEQKLFRFQVPKVIEEYLKTNLAVDSISSVKKKGNGMYIEYSQGDTRKGIEIKPGIKNDPNEVQVLGYSIQGYKDGSEKLQPDVRGEKQIANNLDTISIFMAQNVPAALPKAESEKKDEKKWEEKDIADAKGVEAIIGTKKLDTFKAAYKTEFKKEWAQFNDKETKEKDWILTWVNDPKNGIKKPEK